MLVVVFDEDFRVTEGLRIERATVEELFPHRAHVNGRIIILTQKLRDHPTSRSSSCPTPRSTADSRPR